MASSGDREQNDHGIRGLRPGNANPRRVLPLRSTATALQVRPIPDTSRGEQGAPSAGRTPRVHVIIVNFDGGALLERSLSALEGQTLPPQRITVVDNASRDRSAHGLEARHPRVEVLRQAENVGFAAANNLAVRSGDDAEWVALLNPDAFPEPEWLERLVAAAAQNPGHSFFASRLVAANTPDRLDGTGDIYTASGLAWRRHHGRPTAGTAMSREEVFSPCAAAALYRRDAYLEAGGFDEGYFCFFEDIDLAFRLRLAGHRCLYVPDAVVHHVGSAITGRRSDFSVYYGHRNLVWTFFKDMPSPLLALYLPHHILLNVASLVWLTLRGQGRVILKAKWDALRGLPRVWRQRRDVQARRRIGAREVRRALARGAWRGYLGRG